LSKKRTDLPLKVIYFLFLLELSFGGVGVQLKDKLFSHFDLGGHQIDI